VNTGVLGRLAATRALSATNLIQIVVGGLVLTEGASLKSGRASSLTRSRRKSHERGLVAAGFRREGGP
jgi:hypothetical protein